MPKTSKNVLPTAEVGLAAGGLQNPVSDGLIFLPAPFLSQDVNAAPELAFGFPPVHPRGDLAEVMFHFSVRCPAVIARMQNIPDVPFPLWSGGEKDQFFSFQQKDPVLSVLFDNFEKGFRKLVFFY